jgi:hypothetical protein
VHLKCALTLIVLLIFPSVNVATISFPVIAKLVVPDVGAVVIFLLQLLNKILVVSNESAMQHRMIVFFCLIVLNV